jgi:hypothetical protein
MEKFIFKIFNLRWQFMKIWLFFFMLSLFWTTPHGVLALLGISAIYSFSIILLVVIISKIHELFRG